VTAAARGVLGCGSHNQFVRNDWRVRWPTCREPTETKPIVAFRQIARARDIEPEIVDRAGRGDLGSCCADVALGARAAGARAVAQIGVDRTQDVPWKSSSATGW
jgi:hypothetical protein